MSATEAARAGVGPDPDGADLEAVYRRHGNWLVAFLRRRFGRQDAEDLAQETYVRTVGVRTHIRNPRAFLARVALRAAREIAEQKASRMVFWPEDETDQPLACEQDEIVLLKQLVLGLPADLKVVLVLSRFAGLTNEEVAARLGISVKRVEARMTKARARLAALMRD